MFKTLYKSSHLIAIAVLSLLAVSTAGAMVLGERAALAQSSVARPTAAVSTPTSAPADAPLIGQFVVTPTSMRFTSPR